MNLRELAAVPMRSESELRMVEIIVLKWKCPEVETQCAERIIRHTAWPFNLTFYDNRANTPNTSRIWNKLVRQATCDYVCLLDSDAFVPDTNPCWLTRMMESFQHADCRVVLPVTDRCSSPQQRIPVQSYPAEVRDDQVWSGFCFLFRRELLSQVGPFDEEFVGYGQDSEFAVRLARQGGGTYVRRDVFVQHVHGASFSAAAKSGEYDATADRAYAQQLYLEKTRQ
jgi:hypothetical protein